MVMALSLFHQGQTLTLVAGYENGQATVAQPDDRGNWNTKYQAKCHTQPILSLDVSPRRDFFLTSSADATIAKHPLPAAQEAKLGQDTHPGKDQNFGNAEPGALATGKSLLSAALASETRPVPAKPTTAAPETPSHPLKTVNTKHSGQQSLRMRSDGRIFATAGWDSAVRVYSAKTLNEVAVLKWHRVGCYATAFAEIETETATEDAREAPAEVSSQSQGTQEGGDGTSLTTVPKLVELTVRDKRIRQAKTAHWLAAGSKDGKVSLWDVF